MGRPGRRLLRLGAVAIVVLLLAACRAAGSGASLPVPAQPSDLVDAPGAVPSVSTSPAQEASPTATATAIVAPQPPSPAPAVDPRADGLDVAFGEYAITLEATVIRPGPVTFIVHNAGRLTHGFEMKLHGSGSGSGSSGGDRLEIETRTFRSGETLRVEADLPAGDYEIECFVADHDEKGMRTSLQVRSDAPLATANPVSTASGTVRIVQFAFVAASLDVPAGTRATWINDDPAPHTVTADGGAFDSKQLDQGAAFSVVLDVPGTFAYHCEIHSTMVGKVIVH